MTELKTLKDLETHSWLGHRCYLDKDLKAEAVKWVKQEDTLYLDFKDWIKDFFNLTEEDIYYEDMKNNLIEEDLK